MEVSRIQFTAVQKISTRFQAIVALSEHEQSVELIARRAQMSISQLYRYNTRVLDALVDRPRGPAPTTPSAVSPTQREHRPCSTPYENGSLRARPLRALTLQLHGAGATARGIQEHFRLQFKQQNNPHKPPSLGAISTFLKQAGRSARTALVVMIAPRLDAIEIAAIDDIYLHGQATKVTLEPISAAVLDVRRWNTRTAEVWDVILAEYPALKLIVGDAAKEFDAVAERRNLRRQFDLMHERQWWNQHIFNPLSKREQACATALARGTDEETLDRTQHQLLQRQRAEFEEAFYACVAVEELICTAFRPLNAVGKRWTSSSLWSHLDRFYDLLAAISADSAADGYAQAAYDHVERSLCGYIAFHHLWDSIKVTLRVGSEWSKDQVLDAVIRERQLRSAAQDDRFTQWEQWPHRRAWQVLQQQIDEAILNGDEVRAAVQTLVTRPARSSSLVEAFNARIRVLQTARRNVSDEMLGLAALQWNVSTREDGPRRGTSPYKLLGVLNANDNRSWWDVLLDFMDTQEQQETN